ncbi:polymorphic toxin type 24 domain-containing protein [Nocardia sp. NPDC004068]|uniref:polymorphic toxin type 24 domain-containing protein n=1 Tax=Nocardia sp. NPDC004068 TaxID=3364303 RepID=UPI00367DEBC6
MTKLDVDPKTYYQAAINCFDAAAALRDSFVYIFAELAECGSMAGVDDDGKKWATSYNTAAYHVVGMFQEVHSTLMTYGSALNDIGFNHAQADASIEGTPQPGRPTDAQAPVFGPFSVPASAGGPGQGIVDKGINIVSEIGIPVPDGHTGRLAKAADAWDRLGTIYQNTNARDKITISATLFDDVTSPEAVHVRDDLRTLSDSIDKMLTACKDISASCIGYKEALDELRKEIKGLLESLLEELAMDAAISIGLALVSFGAGAVTAVKALDSVRRWAAKIKDGILAWRARKALQIAGMKQEAKDALFKARKAVQDLFERLGKKGENVKRVPKPSLKSELDNAQTWTNGNLPAKNGPPNGYLVKRDPQGNISNYTQYDSEGNAVKRVDLTGATHAGVPTPHVVEYEVNVNPNTGEKFPRPNNRNVRPATPEEIP